MLLDRMAKVVPDAWADQAILTAENLETTAGLDHGLGVQLASGAELEPILRHLACIGLVIVPFPGFRDGRGFTAARALREHHDFGGEIRAAGHVLPDQYVALLRVGFSTVALPDGSNLAPWAAALRLTGDLSGNPRALPWIRRTALPFQVV